MTPILRPTAIPFLFAAVAAAQSSWSAPVLEPALNSTASDAGPHLSFDGLTVHFASFRTGNWEIFSSTRPYPGGAWSAPVQVVELGGTGVDDQPFLVAGGLEIVFASNRTGGLGGFDLMRSTRASTALPWDPPTFDPSLNSTGSESSFSTTADGLEAYFLSTGWGAPAAPNNAIFRATRTSTAVPFGTPALVTELANANTHRDCEIAPDGLAIAYTEFLPAPISRLRVFFSTRPDRQSPFAPPTTWSEFDNVGTLSGVFGFSLSWTGDEAMLAAGFAAAAGSQELMNTRRSLFYGAGCGAPVPLALTCTTPVLGTNWDFTTTNVDAVSPVAITFFALAQTSLPLDFLGAIGCTALVDTLVTSATAPNVAGTAVLSVALPGSATLSGAVLTAQSVCFTLGNPFGLYTSNGVRGMLGF